MQSEVFRVKYMSVICFKIRQQNVDEANRADCESLVNLGDRYKGSIIGSAQYCHMFNCFQNKNFKIERRERGGGGKRTRLELST